MFSAERRKYPKTTDYGGRRSFVSEQPRDNKAHRGPQQGGEAGSATSGGLLGTLDPDEPSSRAGLSGAFEHHDVSPETAARQKRRSRASLATAIALFIAALLIVVAVLGSAFGLFERKDYNGAGDQDVNVTVGEGQSTGQIANSLESQDVVANAGYFVETFQERYPEDFIQPGDYQLKTHMSSDAVIDVMMERGEASHYAAVAQTQRIDDTFQTLSESTGLDKSEFEAFKEDTDRFAIPEEFPTLEGWLHPGEYRFPLDATAEQIIQEMVDRTKATLNNNEVPEDQWFRVITVASLVEFEGVPDIYPEVAGAIYNRIDRPNDETNGLIQSDASVTYGLDKRSYHVSDEEKRDKTNPYNTFAHPGLPVGPIGSPGDESIKAAANPDDNDYYYWVTVNLDTGETKFAENFEEHNRNVEQYQQWCSDNEGRCS